MTSDTDTNTIGDKTHIMRISIQSMMEIPLAYQRAIEEYKGDEDNNYCDDVWDAKIELKQINFERNFRRSNYECVFEITLGKFLYGR
jgi:hypothetical protein